MPRGRPKAKVTTQAELLSKALAFVSIATKREEQPYQSHLRLGGNMAIAFNGQLLAGHPIIEELDCCPHADRLVAAINKCGKSLAIALTESGRLSIKGEKLNALVPCMDRAEMPDIGPDAPHPQAVVGDELKAAFKACGVLASEAAENVVAASLLLENLICTGSDRKACIQYFHGFGFPFSMVLPKIFTEAVARVEHAITGFGFSWDGERNRPSSVTIWFENGAWLKTLTYADNWPELPFMSAQYHAVETPAGFFEGAETVAEFNDDGRVYVVDNGVQSHASADQGAQYEVPGLQGGKIMSAYSLDKIAPFAKRIDLTTYEGHVYFDDADGKRIRGCVTSIKEGTGENV